MSNHNMGVAVYLQLNVKQSHIAYIANYIGS